MPQKKLDEYVPKIEYGLPLPERATTVYTRKIVAGELRRIAEQIKPGGCVPLPPGSIGRFTKIVNSRGLKTISSGGQSDADIKVWVVTQEKYKIWRDSQQAKARTRG